MMIETPTGRLTHNETQPEIEALQAIHISITMRQWHIHDQHRGFTDVEMRVMNNTG